MRRVPVSFAMRVVRFVLGGVLLAAGGPAAARADATSARDADVEIQGLVREIESRRDELVARYGFRAAEPALDRALQAAGASWARRYAKTWAGWESTDWQDAKEQFYATHIHKLRQSAAALYKSGRVGADDLDYLRRGMAAWREGDRAIEEVMARKLATIAERGPILDRIQALELERQSAPSVTRSNAIDEQVRALQEQEREVLARYGDEKERLRALARRSMFSALTDVERIPVPSPSTASRTPAAASSPAIVRQPAPSPPPQTPPPDATRTRTRDASPADTPPQLDCEQLSRQCDELGLRAHALGELAGAMLRRLNESSDERYARGEEIDWLRAVAESDREVARTFADQARRWRELAEAAHRAAERHRERARAYPGRGWDDWARIEEQRAADRIRQAEALERQLDELRGRAGQQQRRARDMDAELALQESEVRAMRARADAALAAYHGCKTELLARCPASGGGATVVADEGTSIVRERDGSDPRDVGPPAVPFGEVTDERDPRRCPQRDGRHRECIALVLDFVKHEPWMPGNLDDSRAVLRQLGCEIDAAEPAFRPLPPREYFVEVASADPGELKGIDTSSPRRDAIAHNVRQMAEVRRAIERHRGRLREGAIVAFELVTAHGSRGTDGKPCGSIGAHFDWEVNSLARHELHEKNYEAAKGNVCIRYVMDVSCYSWQTPLALDELNNSGKARCADARSVDRRQHAAYEANLAQACSARSGDGEGPFDKWREVCTGGWEFLVEDDVERALERELRRRLRGIEDPQTAFTESLPDLLRAGSGRVVRLSSYADRGYELCVPDEHIRSGPYWEE